jgi:uncharacterized protein YciI
MNFYIVTMTHPDGPEWNRHVLEHVRYLLGLLEDGSLVASGPLKGTPLRAGFLIFKAEGREAVTAMVAADPFSQRGLIASLTIEHWDPLFGAFGSESSRTLPEDLKPLADQLEYR